MRDVADGDARDDGALRGVDLFQAVRDLLQRDTEAAGELGALGIGGDAARGALIEAALEATLEVARGALERRLGDGKPARGGVDRRVFGDRNETSHLRPGHPVDRGGGIVAADERAADHGLAQRRAEMIEEAPHARQQHGAEAGHIAAGTAPIEQADGEPGFERMDRLGEPRLRQVDLARRRADAFEPRRGFEGAQLAQRENVERGHD